MSRGREREAIARARRRPAVGEETPLPFIVAALVPAVIALPLRLVLFGDSSPFTRIVLGPLFEESTKLAAVMLVLIVAALLLPRGRDASTALGYWIVLAPWCVGGLYGLIEGAVVYPGEGSLDVTLREVAHATFVALSLLGTLLVWRALDAGATGVTLGVLFGFGSHVGFNILAALSATLPVTFLDQAAYVAALGAVVLVGLSRLFRIAPTLPEAARFLGIAGKG